MKEIKGTTKQLKICPNCWGKGYNTEFQGDSFCLADFIGDKTYRVKKAGIRVVLCSCGRSKDLALMFNIKKNYK